MGSSDGTGSTGPVGSGGSGGLAWPADSAGPSGSVGAAEASDLGHAAVTGTLHSTEGGPPGPGTPAPPFSLVDQHGQTVDHRTHAGRQAVLLVFYPFAFSRVCGSELHAIGEHLDDFQNEAVQVLAVSCDALYTLRAYADTEKFEFPLLADHWPHGAAARAFGVFDEAKGCAVRGTFLIDSTGVVRWSVVNGLADPRDLDEYRAAIRALDTVRS